MKFNLQNPLWKTDPEKAKKGFEKELRELSELVRCDSHIDWRKGYIEAILKILG